MTQTTFVTHAHDPKDVAKELNAFYIKIKGKEIISINVTAAWVTANTQIEYDVFVSYKDHHNEE